jgi:hypothetical protein
MLKVEVTVRFDHCLVAGNNLIVARKFFGQDGHVTHNLPNTPIFLLEELKICYHELSFIAFNCPINLKFFYSSYTNFLSSQSTHLGFLRLKEKPSISQSSYLSSGLQ